MEVLFKSNSYAVVKLTESEMKSIGTSSAYSVIDVFYDKVPMLKNIVGTFRTPEEAEDWARDHE